MGKRVARLLKLTLVVPTPLHRKAPCLPVDTMEGALDQAFQWRCMFPGFEEFKISGRITRDTINSNVIFEMSQLKEALVQLDAKVHHKVSQGFRNTIWADEYGSFLHACIIDLLKVFRNTKDCTRTPLWLQNLFKLLHNHNLQHTRHMAPFGVLAPHFLGVAACKGALGDLPVHG